MSATPPLKRGDLSRAYQRSVNAAYEYDEVRERQDIEIVPKDEIDATEEEFAQALASLREVIDAYEELLPENPLTMPPEYDRV